MNPLESARLAQIERRLELLLQEIRRLEERLTAVEQKNRELRAS